MSSIITFTYCSKWNHPIYTALSTSGFCCYILCYLVLGVTHLCSHIHSLAENYEAIQTGCTGPPATPVFSFLGRDHAFCCLKGMPRRELLLAQLLFARGNKICELRLSMLALLQPLYRFVNFRPRYQETCLRPNLRGILALSGCGRPSTYVHCITWMQKHLFKASLPQLCRLRLRIIVYHWSLYVEVPLYFAQPELEASAFLLQDLEL